MSQSFDDLKEEFLAHAGVKGMKWGKRKAVDTSALSAGGQRRAERIDNSSARGADRVNASNGSRGKAITKVVARNMVTDLLLGAGVQTIGKLTGNPSVTQGAAAVASLLSLGNTIKSVSDIVDISRAVPEND